MLSAPTSTAPWASRRAMTVASRVAGARSRLIFEPARVGSPAMSNKFLTANGTPASAPSRRPRALGVDRRGLGERALRGDGGERVEDAIMFRDPRPRRAHDRGRARAAVADGSRNLARVRPGGVHQGGP